jgi:hypothetical protein
MGLRSAILLIAAGLGCQTSASATRTDLRAYLAHTRTWAPVEADTARTIERILRTEFVDEAEVLRHIAESRPRIAVHLQRLRAFTPHSVEVRRVHARYVEAWQKLLDGYDAIERGFATGDYTELARGREAMADWKATILDVARELRQLMDHFGVEPDGAIESRSRDDVQAVTQRT